jgi:hypothetical protein
MTNELLTHIRNLNAKSAAWVAEDPKNRMAGMLVEDVEHWNSIGVTTVAEFEHYNLANEVYDLHKSVYGFRPNYGHLKSLTVKELEEELESLNRAWKIERKDRAVRERINRKLRHAQQVAWLAKKKEILSHRSGFTIGELVGA